MNRILSSFLQGETGIVYLHRSLIRSVSRSTRSTYWRNLPSASQTLEPKDAIPCYHIPHAKGEQKQQSTSSKSSVTARHCRHSEKKVFFNKTDILLFTRRRQRTNKERIRKWYINSRRKKKSRKGEVQGDRWKDRVMSRTCCALFTALTLNG